MIGLHDSVTVAKKKKKTRRRINERCLICSTQFLSVQCIIYSSKLGYFPLIFWIDKFCSFTQARNVTSYDKNMTSEKRRSQIDKSKNGLQL